MMKFKRIYSKLVNPKIRSLMKSLNDDAKTPEYRFSMFQLGLELGNEIVSQNPKTKYFYLVCTVEDADFLAKGIMESFNINNKAFNLACFWNSREKTKNKLWSISPVIRKYVEPYSPPKNSKGKMVIVKSLISGSCVVKTNIKEVIDRISPQKIIVTAPVMHKDARSKLEKEFDKKTVDKFDYVYFATDYNKENDYVRPGIGDVYKLLGLGNQVVKNKYTPLVVKERRSAYL
ncbi:MAG: hypothetical protein PHY93_08910 [Bacteriovorax sp.]|nr:hypothetical protein [Bacteriovorax sp.]